MNTFGGHNTADAGATPVNPGSSGGESSNQQPLTALGDEPKNQADSSDARATPIKNKDGYTIYPNYDEEELGWPPDNAATLVTDDARLYLLSEHDIFLEERYIQKLRHPKRLLEGKRRKFKEGGQILEITIRSLDTYAQENPDKKIEQSVSVKTSDKLYNDFSEIIQNKPYELIIDLDGDARATPVDPLTSAQSEVEHKEEPKNAEMKQTAKDQEGATPIDPPTSADQQSLISALHNQLTRVNNWFENERSKREHADTLRENERISHLQDTEALVSTHLRERDNLIRAEQDMLNKLLRANMDKIKLIAAYKEAISHLPEDTQLFLSVDDVEIPDSPTDIQPQKRINFTPASIIERE